MVLAYLSIVFAHMIVFVILDLPLQQAVQAVQANPEMNNFQIGQLWRN